MRRAPYNDALWMFFGGLCSLGFLLGLLPDVARSAIGMLLGLLAFAGAVVLVFSGRQGQIAALVVGPLAFGLTYLLGSLPSNPLAQQWVGRQFGAIVAAPGTQPPPTRLPTTARPTALPPTAAPTAAPPTATPALEVAVFNGGNLRERPAINGTVLDQINAQERVELHQRSADQVWYYVTNARGVTGWVHGSLLTVPADIGAQLPVAAP
ncbi:MAG: hypothetical protein OHK0022_40330 [Roseiflexaceae bacterium]